MCMTIEHNRANLGQRVWTSTVCKYLVGRKEPHTGFGIFKDRFPRVWGGLKRCLGKDLHRLPM
jgi:hypothetical protein